MKYVVAGWVPAGLIVSSLVFATYLIFRGEDDGVYSSYNPSFLDQFVPAVILWAVGLFGASISVSLGRFYRLPRARAYRRLLRMSLGYFVLGLVMFMTAGLASLSLVVIPMSVMFVILLLLRRGRMSTGARPRTGSLGSDDSAREFGS